MYSYESQKRQWSGRLVISRQQLSESFKDFRHAFKFDRYRRSLRKSIGENIYAWMSSAAILGWVLSRIPAKKEKVYLLGVIARNGILSTLRRSRGSFDLKKRSRIRLQLVLCDNWHGNHRLPCCPEFRLPDQGSHSHQR